MKLSIIMPVYNAEQYLRETIDSVLNQTFRDFELLLIDDGSTDSSAGICDFMACMDSRIVVIHQKNKGIGGARNAGLDNAKGEYIGFCDNDDLLHPQLFETLVAGIGDSNRNDIVMCDYAAVYRGDQTSTNFDISKVNFIKEEAQSYFQNVFGYSATNTKYCVIWNKIYSKQLIGDTRFPAYGTEDTVFNVHLYLKHPAFVRTTNVEPLYYWITRRDSVSHSDFSKFHLMSLQSYFDLSESMHELTSEYTYLAIDRNFRTLLSTRLNAKNSPYMTKTKQLIRREMKWFLPLFLREKRISVVRKCEYLILYYVPGTYHLFRMFSEMQYKKCITNA